MSTEAALPEVIETSRLVLRPWRLGDVDDVLAYAGDPEWSRYLHALPRSYTQADAERFVARQILMDRSTHPCWAVSLDGRVVGGINLRLNEKHRLGEIGYSIGRTHWRRGYATEAATAVVHEAFDRLAWLGRVRAFADARNAASHRVLIKLGMTKEGVLRRNRIERDEATDETWFGVLREEWAGAAAHTRHTDPDARAEGTAERPHATLVRPAERADRDTWLEMRRALWPEGSPSEHAEEIDRYLAGSLSRPAEVLIALGGRAAALGFVELSIRPWAEGCLTDRVAYLEGWYVVPSARRRGVGRALIEAAERWALGQGCTELASDALIDNRASDAAHRATGFEAVERVTCFRKALPGAPPRG